MRKTDWLDQGTNEGDHEVCPHVVDNIDQTERWLKKVQNYVSTLIIDQRLILAGYEIEFAVDFNEVCKVLHPFNVPNPEAPEAGEQSLESLLACAYLLYQQGMKPHLSKPILLRPYLDELVEHLSYLQTYADRLQREKGKLRDQISRLKKLPGISRLIDAGTENRDYSEEEVLELAQLLSSRFSDVARILWAQELNLTLKGPILNINLESHFSSPPILNRTMREKVDRLSAGFVKLLWAKRHTRRLKLIHPDCNTRRDAEALATVSVMNEEKNRQKDRQITLLLTSTEAIESAVSTKYQQNPEVRDFAQSMNLSRKWTDKEGNRVGYVPDTVPIVRSPFHVVMFLCFWPGDPGEDDRNQREELIRRCQASESRAMLAETDIRETLLFYRDTCLRKFESCEHKNRCTEIRKKYGELAEALGSWRNVGISLQRNDLVPEEMRPHSIAKRVIQSLQTLLRSPELSRKIDEQLRELRHNSREVVENTIRRIVFDGIESQVDETFIEDNFGRISAFPYRIRFTNEAVRNAVSNCINACRAARSRKGGPDTGINECVETFRNAIEIIIDAKGEGLSQDRVNLTAAFLMLLGEYEMLDKFVDSRDFASDQGQEQEWFYIWTFSKYVAFRIRGGLDEQTVKWFSGIVDPLLRKQRDPDLRIQNLMALMRLNSVREDLDTMGQVLPSEKSAIEVWRKIVAKGNVVAALAGDDFPNTSLNNLAFALATVGRRTGAEKMLREARELGERLRAIDDPPPEFLDTIGRCYGYWGLEEPDTRTDDLQIAVENLQKALNMASLSRLPWTDRDSETAGKLLLACKEALGQ